MLKYIYFGLWFRLSIHYCKLEFVSQFFPFCDQVLAEDHWLKPVGIYYLNLTQINTDDHGYYCFIRVPLCLSVVYFRNLTFRLYSIIILV